MDVDSISQVQFWQKDMKVVKAHDDHQMFDAIVNIDSLNSSTNSPCRSGCRH